MKIGAMTYKTVVLMTVFKQEKLLKTKDFHRNKKKKSKKAKKAKTCWKTHAV